MGIQSLAQLLEEHAPDCMEEVKISSLFGQKVALDANQTIMAAADGGAEEKEEEKEPLSSALHVQRVFRYTAQFLKDGIKPVFVFDGEIKSGLGSSNQQATAETLEYCKLLLGLMGIPVVDAPCEALAQAAALVKVGLVYGASSGRITRNGSMDALLAFQTPLVLENLYLHETSKAQRIHFEHAMQLLDLTSDQFVDLCILLGCDYCDTIPGMDAATALQWIRDYICIEAILEVVQEENANSKTGRKYSIPPSWLPPKDAIAEGNEDEEEEEETGDAEPAKVPEFVPAYVRARKKFQDQNVGVDAEEVERDVAELEKIYAQNLMEDMNKSFELKPSRPPSRTNSNNAGSLNGGSMHADSPSISGHSANLSGHSANVSGHSGNLDWIVHHRASNAQSAAGDLGASMASFISDGYFDDDDEDFEVTEEMRKQWEADIED